MTLLDTIRILHLPTLIMTLLNIIQIFHLLSLTMTLLDIIPIPHYPSLLHPLGLHFPILQNLIPLLLLPIVLLLVLRHTMMSNMIALVIPLP